MGKIFNKIMKIAIDSIILPVEVIKDATSEIKVSDENSLTSSRLTKIKESAKDIYTELEK